MQKMKRYMVYQANDEGEKEYYVLEKLTTIMIYEINNSINMSNLNRRIIYKTTRRRDQWPKSLDAIVVD